MKSPDVTDMSSDRGLAGWFRRWFSANPPAQRPVAHSAPHAAVPAEVAAAPLDAAWAEHAASFAPYAQVLALPFQLPTALSEAQQAQVAQLGPAVLEAAAEDEDEPNALPTAALRVLNMAARSDLEVAELASELHQDAGLTAAVLRVANSAGNGPVTGEVSTVRDAVMRLGVSDSARVAGAVAAKALFAPRSKSLQTLFAARFSELHVAAASDAAGAAYLAMTRRIGRSDHAYLGGMLHDVGKSLVLGGLATLMLADRAPRDLPAEVIDAVIARHHIELGVRAHERWGLPRYLTELCAYQSDEDIPATHTELHLVRVVSGLLALRARPQSLQRIQELAQSLGALHITPREARALDGELRLRTAQVRQAFGA